MSKALESTEEQLSAVRAAIGEHACCNCSDDAVARAAWAAIAPMVLEAAAVELDERGVREDSDYLHEASAIIRALKEGVWRICAGCGADDEWTRASLEVNRVLGLLEPDVCDECWIARHPKESRFTKALKGAKEGR